MSINHELEQKTILLVDDELNVLAALQRALTPPAI